MFGLTRPIVLFCDGDNALELIKACNEMELNSKVFSFDDNVPDTTYVDTIFENFQCEHFYV